MPTMVCYSSIRMGLELLGRSGNVIFILVILWFWYRADQRNLWLFKGAGPCGSNSCSSVHCNRWTLTIIYHKMINSFTCSCAFVYWWKSNLWSLDTDATLTKKNFSIFLSCSHMRWPDSWVPQDDLKWQLCGQEKYMLMFCVTICVQ